MHMKSALIGLAIGVGTVLAVGAAPSPQDAGGMTEEMMAQMQQMMVQMGTPGDAHEFLTRFEGKWTGTMGIVGMGQEPAKQTIDMILDGRFMLTDYDGNMMGTAFKGLGIMGYDNYKKKFVSVWTDSMSTAMHYSEGMLDQTGDTLTLWGTMDEYMTGEHDKPVKYVYRFVSDDTYEFEIHDLAIIPGESKVVSGTFTKSN